MNKKFFRRFSWFLVAYNVMVILWGAVVRSTGSGAGCGNHWPLCNGEVIPTAPQITTIIEFSHRMSSMLDGFLVIFLVFLAYRHYGKRSSVFHWALAALVVIIIEGMLGRLLVVQDWVADNVSIIRAVVVAVHLVNTYILLLTLTITAWKANLKIEVSPRKNKRANTLVGIGLGSAIIFSAMGAVTALGDTLFPAEALFTGVPHDLEGAGRFLVQLRVIHPILAILTAGYLSFVVWYLLNQGLGGRVERRGKWLVGVIAVQVMAGGFTVLTLAPLFMQILHLLLADVFWISLVLFSLEVYYSPRKLS
ncbi:COX15/CtaA family protein [bacterium]|nr:COX15/CtaA family protein [bacterium]